MSVPIEYDQRYKVNPEIIKRMKELRLQGLSYNKIRKQLNKEGVSIGSFSVYYWLNEAYREHKRKKNAMRTHPDKKAHVRSQVERTKRYWNIPSFRFSHLYDTAQAEIKAGIPRHTIKGIPLKDAKKMLVRGRRKLDEAIS